MFPNLFSSSYEISSKCNAFVQIEDEGNEGLRKKLESLNSSNPSFEVPEMWDECMVVNGDGKIPNLTVIANHPSQAASSTVKHSISDGDSKSLFPSRLSVHTTVTKEMTVDDNSAAASLLSVKSVSYNCSSNCISSSKASSRGKTPFDIPTNDIRGGSYQVCDYYTRWGIEKGGLRGGGESSLAAGTGTWGAPPTGTSGSASGWNGGGGTGNTSGNGGSSGNAGGQQSQGSGQQNQWGSNNNRNNQQPQNSGNNPQQQQGGQQVGNSQQGGSAVGSNQNITASSGVNNQSGGNNAPPSNNNNTQQGQSQQQGQQGVAGNGPSSQQSTSQPVTSNQPSNSQTNNQTANNQGMNSAVQQGSQGQGSGNGQIGNTGGTSSNNNNNGNSGQPNGSNGQSGNQPVNSGSTSGGNWGGNNGGGKSGNGSNSSTSQTTTSTKQQMEQLNSMREALFSPDGWGGQNVNQDSHWDIPGSPEPGAKEPPPSHQQLAMWKPISNVVAGTDLWEANLRNGGAMPAAAQPAQKTPWTHTPANNIGGTWGEEDDMDTSNLWTGVPPSSAATAGSGQQWSGGSATGGGGGSGAGGGGGGGPMWTGSGGGGKKDGEWGTPSSWAPDQRDMRTHSSELRQMMAAAAAAAADPRDHMRAGPAQPHQQQQPNLDHRVMGGGGNDVMMRGEARGISGRLNGVTGDGMWQGPHHHLGGGAGGPHGKAGGGGNLGGAGQWGSAGGGGAKPTGWEEPSPPTQRRAMPNYDDGTSLWGTQGPARQAIPTQSKVSHWKDLPSSQGNICRSMGPPRKPDPSVWPHAQRNGWGDASTMDGVGGGGPGGWDDKSGTGPGGGNAVTAAASGAPWLDQAPLAWQQGKHAKPWETDMEPSPSWLQGKQAPYKMLTKEVIWNSRQFRILTDMQFKKEDVENALRASSMNLEDALDLLNREVAREIAVRIGGAGRPAHADLDPSDPHSIVNPFTSAQGLCLPGYQGPPPARPQPAQQPQQPSTQQLRLLVQQIQMAVQAGYLNQQILSQPLAPPTLLLLNQLLNQIKLLQNLQTIMYQSQAGSTKPPSHQMLQTHVKITQTKQHIQNLQNQIANNQAVYIKQQSQIPQQQQQPSQQPPQGDLFRSNAVHDPISSLQSNFPDLSLKDPQMSGTSQQSRLNQWKLPLLDKDGSGASGAGDLVGSSSEFSRAPGPAKAAQGSSSPNINPLSLSGPPADSTWSSARNCETGAGWPVSAGNTADSSQDDSKDAWPTSTQPQPFSDLVPEFKPGEPWKGNPQKTIEDDPSLTPAQCVRSPLLPSINIKDSHILSNNGGNSGSGGGGKVSPTSSSSLDLIGPINGPIPSLGPSTWSFTPPQAPVTSSSGGMGKLVGSGSGGSATKTWGDPATPGGEIWNGGKASRPPPGIPSKPGVATPTSTNGWSAGGGLGGGSGATPRWSQPSQPPQPSWNPSTWLLLRNLTPQIDGSTLKTLCLQHGPLTSFHLYLSNGIALARYTSREEAQKAQGALNNCVLGNTTIFAENPSDNDVGPLVQHLSHGSSSGGGGGAGGAGSAGAGGGAGGNTTWRQGTVWSSNTASASLWADSTTDQHRNTPSSLNSFLPGDLLGGESL